MVDDHIDRAALADAVVTYVRDVLAANAWLRDPIAGALARGDYARAAALIADALVEGGGDGLADVVATHLAADELLRGKGDE